jgi:hypothetical protein
MKLGGLYALQLVSFSTGVMPSLAISLFSFAIVA